MKKVAIIGAGQIAEKVHVSYYNRRKDEVKIVAVVDPLIDRAKKFARDNGIEHYYTSIEDMLVAEKIDFASVCTPNRFHFDAVMKLLEKGIAVFCEKPPAMTAQEAKLMYKKALEKKVLLAFDFQHRFAYETQELKKEFHYLGDVYYVEADALRRSGVPGWGNFINKELQGGGPLIDLGIHMLDTVMYLLDFPPIKKVQAYSFQKIGPYKFEVSFGTWDPQQYTVEDSLFGTIELQNGCVIRLNTSFALNMKEDTRYNIRMFGDKAGATLYPLEVYRDQRGELEWLRREELSLKDKHEMSMKHFVDTICFEKEPNLSSAKQGYQIQKIVELLYASAELGEAIEYETTERDI